MRKNSVKAGDLFSYLLIFFFGPNSLIKNAELYGPNADNHSLHNLRYPDSPNWWNNAFRRASNSG